MTHLEIKHLRMLDMITRTNNMTRAAENLHISQSALSQQLKDIEHKLEAGLFFRTGKKMVLTRIGKKLLERGRPIIDRIERAELEVARTVNGETGELKIGVRCVFCYQWLPDVIKKFRDKFPNVDIEIGNSIFPEKDLISGRFDIAISAAEKMDKRIAYTPLFEDDMLCTMSSGDRFSRKKCLEPRDFHGADMIALVEKSNHSFYQELLFDQGIQPRRYMTIAHPGAMVELIAAGLGIGMLPGWFVTPHTKTKDIVTCPLTANGMRLEWKATYLKGNPVPPYQKEFLRIINTQEFLDQM